MTSIVPVIVLVFAAIMLLGYGVYLQVTRKRTILAERLETYANIEEEAARSTDDEMQKLGQIPRLLQMVFGPGYLARVEENLARADIPMRSTEYLLLRGVLVLLGYLMRRAKFVRQLADALMLLTNSLRSGYGFLKGLELIAKEMGDPISKELNRMLREVNLGTTVDDALLNLGRRMNSQDLDIVIGAYLVQKDVGGNLTEIMEKVAETIRERLRIQGDVRVLTTQGKLSGFVVGFMPFVVFLILILTAPDYFSVMFGPPTQNIVGYDIPMGVLLMVGAVFWQLIGAYMIYKIVSVKV
jgi:tight adherence protein B